MGSRMNQVEVNLHAGTPTAAVTVNQPTLATDPSTIPSSTIAVIHVPVPLPVPVPVPVTTKKRKESPIKDESANPSQVKQKRTKQSSASNANSQPTSAAAAASTIPATVIQSTPEPADEVDPETHQMIVKKLLKPMLDPKSKGFVPISRGVQGLPMPPEPTMTAITINATPTRQMPLSWSESNQDLHSTAAAAGSSSIPFLITRTADSDTQLHPDSGTVPMRRVQSQPMTLSSTAARPDSAITPPSSSSATSSTSPMSEEKTSKADYVRMIVDGPLFKDFDETYRHGRLTDWCMELPTRQLFLVAFMQQLFGFHQRPLEDLRGRSRKKATGQHLSQVDCGTGSHSHALRSLPLLTQKLRVELQGAGYRARAVTQTSVECIHDKFVSDSSATHTGLFELFTRWSLPTSFLQHFVFIKGTPQLPELQTTLYLKRLGMQGDNLASLFDYWIGVHPLTSTSANFSTSSTSSSSIPPLPVDLQALREMLEADGFDIPTKVASNMTPLEFVVLLLKVNMLTDYLDSRRLKRWIQDHLSSQLYESTKPAESHPSSSAAGPKPTLASITSWSEDHPVSPGTHMVQPNYSSSDFSPTIKHSMAASSSTSHSSYFTEHLQPQLSQLPATLSPFRLLSSDTSSHAEPLGRGSSTSHFPSSSPPPSLHFLDPFSGSAMMSAAMPINSQFTSPNIHFPQIEDNIQLHHDLRDPLPLSPSFSSLSANDLPPSPTPSSRPPTPTSMDEGSD